jgi:arylsulfatase A-like enzyme
MTRSDRPNILFLFPDQQRAEYVGYAGQVPVRTPHLDRLAGEGVRFSDAVVPSPLCAPSRACIALGQEYDHNPVAGNGDNLPQNAATFYRRLRDEAGYHVMGCGKFDLHKATLDWGLDGRRCIEQWGFSDGVDSEGKWDGVRSGWEEPKGPYLKYLHDHGLAAAYTQDMWSRRPKQTASHATALPEEAYGDNWVGANALALLERKPADRPWFLQVNFPGPHDPWDVTLRMKQEYDGVDFPPAFDNDTDEPRDINYTRQNYASMCTNIDRLVGELLARLERTGELDNTLVIYSSDHGEMLGDMEGWGKSKPFHGSIHVPMLVWGPKLGVAGGIEHAGPTSNLDVTATCLDFAGLEAGTMDSRSLRPVLSGQTSEHRDIVLSGLGAWRVAYDGRWKLVVDWDDAPRQLFDLHNDPHESTDVAGKNPDVVDRLQGRLLPKRHATA